MSRTRARSIIRRCSRRSTASAIKAGSAPNTGRAGAPRTAWAGAGRMAWLARIKPRLTIKHLENLHFSALRGPLALLNWPHVGTWQESRDANGRAAQRAQERRARSAHRGGRAVG